MHAKTLRLSRYLLPACIAACIFVTLFMPRAVQDRAESPANVERPEEEASISVLPHGRVLTVVVDEKAIYVGEDPISFARFGDWLRENRHRLKPDFVVVVGTDLARYGNVARAYAQVHEVWTLPQIFETRSIAVGMRYPAIRFFKHVWDYDLDGSIVPAPGLLPDHDATARCQGVRL